MFLEEGSKEVEKCSKEVELPPRWFSVTRFDYNGA